MDCTGHSCGLKDQCRTPLTPQVSTRPTCCLRPVKKLYIGPEQTRQVWTTRNAWISVCVAKILKVKQFPLTNWPYSLDNILYLNHTLLLNAILTK